MSKIAHHEIDVLRKEAMYHVTSLLANAMTLCLMAIYAPWIGADSAVLFVIVTIGILCACAMVIIEARSLVDVVLRHHEAVVERAQRLMVDELPSRGFSDEG